MLQNYTICIYAPQMMEHLLFLLFPSFDQLHPYTKRFYHDYTKTGEDLQNKGSIKSSCPQLTSCFVTNRNILTFVQGEHVVQ